MLSYILAKDYKKALKKLDYIVSTIAKKYVGELWLIRGIVNQIMGNDSQARTDFARAFKYDGENARKFLKRGENIELPIFPQQ